MYVMITTENTKHTYKNSEKTQENKMAAVKVVIFKKILLLNVLLVL